ncbi:MAG: glycerate kinase [Bacteroidota bacterium]
MKILLAPDKFKGSLSAQGVCDALTAGIRAVLPEATLLARPLADGGDGSLEILGHYLPLVNRRSWVQDPLGRPIKAEYFLSGDKAYIEMTRASGLVLLSEAERNCLQTTSHGTGELIADAIQQGATTIYLFIGGSATNDGGIGIAHALGFRFLDQAGQALAPIGGNLNEIVQIEAPTPSQLAGIQVKVLCDVANPFYGPEGAAHVYAAQKGASPEEIDFLDQGLKHLAEVLNQSGFPDVAQLPGAGAAGGVGGGSVAFLGAELISGIQLFLELADLEAHLQQYDLIITGEGKLDRQTKHGKVVSGVCELAKRHQVPVIAVCGVAEDGVQAALGIQEVYSVLEQSDSIEEAMTTATEKLQGIGREIASRLQA